MTVTMAEKDAWGGSGLRGAPCEIAELDAHAQAALVFRGELTPEELVEGAIRRIERIDPLVNAVSNRAYSRAIDRAEQIGEFGEMPGVPCLLKDSLPYIGMASQFGSRLFEDPEPDKIQFPFADRLDAVGLIQLGKTRIPEFSLLPTTEGELAGPTRNPWSLQHSAGGSSGGAAVAVATGMVPFAHGGDGGGSIRIPASCCGVVGFKPSRGANLRARQFHFIEDLLVSDGLIAHSMRDAAWAARLLRPDGWRGTGAIGTAPTPLRIAVCTADLGGNQPDPEVESAVLATADLCASLGHRITLLDRHPDGAGEAQPLFRQLWLCLARDLHQALAQRFAPELLAARTDAWLCGLAEEAAELTPGQIEQCYVGSGRVCDAMTMFFASHDILLTPVVSTPPPLLGHLSPARAYEALREDMFSYIGYTPLQNIAGQCSVSLPFGQSTNGLPIGSMFSAAQGNDDLLLQLCAQIEEARPWASRKPPIHASAHHLPISETPHA